MSQGDGGPAHEPAYVAPPPPDQGLYEEAAAKAAIGQLDAVRGTAEKWAGSVTALLGVFSSVALITGAEALADVNNANMRRLLFGLVVAAGVAAAASVIFAAQAAQGSLPKAHANWNGDALRALISDETPKAVEKLRKSRIAGLTAAIVVFAIGVLTLLPSLLPEDPATGSSVVVVDEQGNLRCGTLATGPDGTATVAEQPVSGNVQVTVVDSC